MERNDSRITSNLTEFSQPRRYHGYWPTYHGKIIESWALLKVSPGNAFHSRGMRSHDISGASTSFCFLTQEFKAVGWNSIKTKFVLLSL